MSPEQSLLRARSLPASPAGARRLTAMLRQDSAAFRGLSTSDAEWLRGQLLALLALREVSPAALALIAEELATSANPMVLAAAARTLRPLRDRDPAWLPLLEGAAARIARDEYVRFEVDGPRENPLTAREELQAAIELARPRSCCAERRARKGDAPHKSALQEARGITCRNVFEKAIVEDQDGRRATLAALTAGSRTLLALFYTRCMNPLKCSATITCLGSLAAQREKGQHSLRVIGLSYDGRYDTPARLKGYGLTRNFHFGDEARLVRCTRGWQPLRRALDLQVGYGDTTVNEHARELLLIEPDLTVHALAAHLIGDPALLLETTAAARRGHELASAERISG